MISFQDAPLFKILICATALMASSLQSMAEDGRFNFTCAYDEQCGTLVETACSVDDGAFLLQFEQAKGFSIVMYNEVWISEKVETTSTREDLTTLVLNSPSGEVALFTVDQDWQFAMSIQYTGLGEGPHWISGNGTCKVVS
jgi:hypothetical protein